MSSVKIKICGITTAADARLCREAGAEYLGFVFYPGSPRNISPEAAGKIIRELGGTVTSVGVFVNPSPEDVERTARISGIRAVQLAGEETPEFCGGVTLPVIKVVRPAGSGTGAPSPRDYPVFATMVDGCAPGKFGGTGVLADPDFAASCASATRCFLAGGLDAGNVASILSRVSPYAVDVSSGTETSPGVKDPSRVREFCRAVFQHHQQGME